jgi:ribonucleotide reductase class II
MTEFNDFAPSAPAVFYRSYSRRKENGVRENFNEAITRTINAIAQVGELNPDQTNLILEMGLKQHCFPSGRALWVAGTEWAQKQDNFPGYYNCCSMHVDDVSIFGLLMELAMMGTGTGAVLEEEVVNKLPRINRAVFIESVDENIFSVGGVPDTEIEYELTEDNNPVIRILVGDSRQGWASAYQGLIELATGKTAKGEPQSNNAVDAKIILDLTQVRPSGQPLKGFGGTANPVRLRETFERAANILSKAVGRKLTSIECCLLIDEAASAVVAGNIRRSAGMRQFGSNDAEAIVAKDGLYKQDESGNWSVDPEKEALRMANHTRCFHSKPSLEEVKEAVTKQFWSGEGAIMYVPESVARANVDLLDNKQKKDFFLSTYVNGSRDAAKKYLKVLAKETGKAIDNKTLDHRMDRYGLNPCGEIIMRDNLCNLAEVHLNTIDPKDIDLQKKAFYAAGLQVASLLRHKFSPERLAYSREIDPIVGVSFTGLFDFLVHAFGADWLTWMMDGARVGFYHKKYTNKLIEYLTIWKTSAEKAVKDYCEEHSIRIPNRFTTVQPAGSKSLLTGASPGWHPPKAQRFIRRITFGVNDPLVSALRDYGYNVIPAQSARDEQGNLLDDIADPRVQEVLVEIPTEVSWANIPGCDVHDLSKLPIKAQWYLYMHVQLFYTTHNTSATLEFREDEIDLLSELITSNIQNNMGYISAALLARFDANETFPRLPFEPISKEIFDRRMAAVNAVRSTLPEGTNVLDLLAKYDASDYELKGAAGCDSAKCLTESEKDTDQVGLLK